MHGVQRYVIFAYLVMGWLVCATLARLLNAAFYGLSLPDPAILGSGLALTDVIGYVIGIGATLWAYKHEQANAFSGEVVGEMKKVTWPTKQETSQQTWVVIITTFIIAGILFVFDWTFGKLTGFIYTQQ